MTLISVKFLWRPSHGKPQPIFMGVRTPGSQDPNGIGASCFYVSYTCHVFTFYNFYLLSIWSVKYLLRYSLSTRVGLMKYSVSTAIIIGFCTSITVVLIVPEISLVVLSCGLCWVVGPNFSFLMGWDGVGQSVCGMGWVALGQRKLTRWHL